MLTKQKTDRLTKSAQNPDFSIPYGADFAPT